MVSCIIIFVVHELSLQIVQYISIQDFPYMPAVFHWHVSMPLYFIDPASHTVARPSCCPPFLSFSLVLHDLKITQRSPLLSKLFIYICNSFVLFLQYGSEAYCNAIRRNRCIFLLTDLLPRIWSFADLLFFTNFTYALSQTLTLLSVRKWQ